MANFADLWESGNDPYSGLKADFASRLQSANDAWQAQTGKPIQINSGYRTPEKGIKLWGQRSSNPNLVAKPGTSLHEKGEAADIPADIPDSFLNQYGLHRPYGNKDPVHIEAMKDFKPKDNVSTMAKTEQPQSTSSNFADLWESAPVGNEPKAEEKPAIKQMGEMSKKLGKEFLKPLSEISSEDWKEKSLLAPAIEYTASSLGIPGFTEADKKAAEEKLIKKGKGFAEGVTKLVTEPVNTLSNIAKGIYENPGKFAGETVKGIIYDPEQLVAVPGAGKAVEKIAEGGSKAKAVLSEKLNQAFPKVDEVKPVMAGVGAAQTTNATILQDAVNRASPELKAELQKLKPEQINTAVLERQLEADSLPIPMKLTEGMATRDPKTFSDEMNSRAKNKEYANRYNELNSQLVENLDAIKENASPNVYGTNVVENGQSLIDAYLDLDIARKANIDAKYQALRDAAGGEIPIDGVKFANNAYASLRKELKTEFLPASIKSQLDAFKKGEPMTFEQFEAMRTNLAEEMRSADKQNLGNTEYALGKVREALEDLPLTGETKELKILADEARSAAKQRFDLLDQDKAYKAAVNGKVYADDFINKFVVNGKKKDIDTMVSHLGQDSTARQVMAAGIVNWLKSKSGILNNGSGTFSQKGFNQALQNIDPKILNIVGPEVNQQLKALGNTARNIQERPPGSYVSESNTFTAALGEKAANIAEKGANYAIGGGIFPIGTMTRNLVSDVKESAKVKESLKPGAGVKLKDIGKK
jgi:hypothetical protein